MDLALVIDVADKKNCKIKDKLLQMHFIHVLPRLYCKVQKKNFKYIYITNNNIQNRK